MKSTLLLLLSVSLIFPIILHGENIKRYESINSGVVWFDQNNEEVNAHGACIVKEGDVYYLFGEYKSDTINSFAGFSCYSSIDLYNWKFERIVFPVQVDGLLGPNRIGERVKVMKCPSTGEFVMYMHCDDLKYNDPHVGYATCATIDGEYQFQGDLLHEGKYLRKWDLGTFQDYDDKGYLLTHEGFIYELSQDYKSIQRIRSSNIAKGGESPAMFKSGGTYFWLFSNKTSWERNDNYYLTSTSLDGEWSHGGNFAPLGSLTWNSQCSFVLPIVNGQDTLNMYMGDRWSFPKQGSAGTYVWQPIIVEGSQMSICNYSPSWVVNNTSEWLSIFPRTISIERDIRKKGNWYVNDDALFSNEKGASLSFQFSGQQIDIRGVTGNRNGYARVVLTDSENKEVLNTIIDFYSKNEIETRVFLSPKLKYGSYTLTVEVMGEHGVWYKKDGTIFGSTDNYVVIEDVFYN